MMPLSSHTDRAADSHSSEFEENNVAVVVDNGEVKGIINKIDLLEFINKKSRSGD